VGALAALGAIIVNVENFDSGLLINRAEGAPNMLAAID
jgi:hypothetical protein